ncbi:MAG: cupin domain-containing protein [Anaerolineae bacterium]|nr:cupin domain-containing protein [Anaerolineae bacterium]
MLVKESAAVTLEAVQAGIGIRWLLQEVDGTPNFAMRLIEIEPGAIFEMHQHPYEHEIYVLEGEGVVMGGDGEQRMAPGVALLVLPDELHGYRNPGKETLKFICITPNP